jgi:hypothetical protein
MPLPPRQEFDLEGAADYLGCNVSDINYHLDKGSLRLAVPTSLFMFMSSSSVPFADLSSGLQDKLKSLYNPDAIDFISVKLDEDLNASDDRPFVYLNNNQRNKIIRTIHKLGEPIWIFESLERIKVTQWRENHLAGCWLYEESGWIVDTVLLREELDRFKPEDSGATAEPKSTSGKTNHPFKLPTQVDDIADAMVAYGNRFFKEKGATPTFADLQGYMLEVGGKSLQMTYDPKGKDYFFGDKPISKRAFGDRYKKYLVKPK